MKTSKRALASIMALVFVFTSVFSFSATIASAANFTDVPETSAYYEAINSLVDRGVINGYEDGSFKPDNTITRAEFSKLLATSSAPTGTQFTATTTQFPDVADSSSPSAWAIPYISYAVGVKAINGYEDGTFRPTNTVTYGEAIKMIVCTLGYDPVVDKTLTPWYQGYIDVANQIKLTQNVVSLGDSPAPRGLVAQLIFNMLGCKPLVQIGVDMNGNPVYSVDGESSFDEQKDNATEEEGVLLGLIDYTLTGQALKRTQVQIGNDVFDIGDYTVEDLKALIGRTVTYKYNNKNAITYIREAAGYNEEVVVNASQIENVTSSYLTYYENEEAERDGEETKISMPNLLVVYNGVPVPYDEIGAGFDIPTYLNVFDGSITFLSNDGNNKTAEVAFVESYRTYFANTPSTSNKITTIYDQYPAQSGRGTPLTLDANEVASVKKVTSKGGKPADAKLTDIKKGMVVSVAYPYPINPSDNGEKASVIFSTATVSGQVTEMNDDYSYIKIGNVEYEVSPYFETIRANGLDVSFKVNDSGKFYLDRLGRIVFFEKNQSSNPYALAVRYNATSGFNALYGIDLYISGTQGTQFFPLKEEVKVNGSLKDAAEVIDFLISTCPTYDPSFEGGKYILQPIKYATTTNSTTGNKEISAIECMDPDNGYQDGVIVPYAIENTANSAGAELFANGGKVTYTKSGYAFKKGTATQFALGSSSVIFAIPQDITNVKAYRKYTRDSFSEGGNYVVEPYDVEKNTAKVALYYLTSGQTTLATVNGATPAYLVEEISDAYDNNNNKVKKIKYYKAGESESKEVFTSADASLPALSSIGKGDVIKFALTEGAVSVIKKVYDYDSATLFTETGSLVSGNPNHITYPYEGTQNYYQAIVGTVYTISEEDKVVNIIPYEAESDGTFTEENIGKRVGLTLNSDVAYYEYDSVKEEFRFMNSSGEVLEYDTYASTTPSIASKVLAIVMNKKVVAVYILN